MDKIQEIRQLVHDFSVTIPEDPEDGFWFNPDRGSPNYFRLVPDEDGYEEVYFDVYIETDITEDKAANVSIKIDVVLFNGVLEFEEDRTTIASQSFSQMPDSTDQNRMQMAIINLQGTYREKAQEQVNKYATWAVSNLSGKLGETAE